MTRRRKHSPPAANLSHQPFRQDNDANNELSEIPDTYDYRPLNDKNSQFHSQRRISKRSAVLQLTALYAQPHVPSRREVHIEIKGNYQEEQRISEISRKKGWTLCGQERTLVGVEHIDEVTGQIVEAEYNIQQTLSGVESLVLAKVQPIAMRYAMFTNPFATNAVKTGRISPWLVLATKRIGSSQIEPEPDSTWIRSESCTKFRVVGRNGGICGERLGKDPVRADQIGWSIYHYVTKVDPAMRKTNPPREYISVVFISSTLPPFYCDTILRPLARSPPHARRRSISERRRWIPRMSSEQWTRMESNNASHTSSFKTCSHALSRQERMNNMINAMFIVLAATMINHFLGTMNTFKYKAPAEICHVGGAHLVFRRLEADLLSTSPKVQTKAIKDVTIMIYRRQRWTEVIKVNASMPYIDQGVHEEEYLSYVPEELADFSNNRLGHMTAEVKAAQSVLLPRRIRYDIISSTVNVSGTCNTNTKTSMTIAMMISIF
ncbi:hypothetical protein K440DRAFT_645152 [Wilcoxina mikolae CBS 423.85]|nr:hypothetical protein K440DRAFT_645152 [Wilcoxina mikolae CBS 423.85]